VIFTNHFTGSGRAISSVRVCRCVRTKFTNQMTADLHMILDK